MSIFTPNNLIPIQEYYVGEIPEVVEIQRLFSIFRETALKMPGYKINSSRSIIAFNRAIERFFGFKTFSLIIAPGVYHNAYTVPISAKLDTGNYGKYCIKTPKGFRYSNDAMFSAAVVMTSNMVLDKRYTDRELLAVIFHEIGHNFTAGISPFHEGFSFVSKAMNVYDAVILTVRAIYNRDIFKGLDAFNTWTTMLNCLTELTNTSLDNNRRYNPDGMNISGFINSIIDYVEVFWSELRSVNVIINLMTKGREIFMNIIESLPKKIFDIILPAINYNDERLSDNFPTIYGYGADMSSWLAKFHTVTRGQSLIRQGASYLPLLSIMLDLLSLPLALLSMPFNDHPQVISRIDDQLKLFEKELNKTDLDPKMRLQIEEDLKETREVMEKYFFTIDGLDSAIVIKASQFLLYKISGGDIRNLYAKMDLVSLYDKK